MTKKKNYKDDPSKSRYISIQCALFEDTKFRNLSPYAKLAFLTIKGHLPLPEFGQIFGISELVSYKTGIPSDQVMGLVQELQDAGFLLYEDHFVWIVRGLEHNPTYGKSHRGMNQNIRGEINKFKDIPLAKAFMEKYAYIWQEESDSREELEGGSPEVSQEVSEGDPYLILSYSSKVVKDIVDTKNSVSRNKKEKENKPESAKRETWVTPYMEAWQETFDAPDIMPVPPEFPKRYFRDLKAGHDRLIQLGHEPEKIQEEFSSFLMTKMLDGDLAYDRSFIESSGSKFFQSFGQWGSRQESSMVRFEARKEGGR